MPIRHYLKKGVKVTTKLKEPLVAVSYRVRPEMRSWLAQAAQKHDRSTNWLVNKILEAAYAQDRQQTQGTQQ